MTDPNQEGLAIFVSWGRWLFGIPVEQVDRVTEATADVASGEEAFDSARTLVLGDWLGLSGSAHAVVLLRLSESTRLALAVDTCVGLGPRPASVSSVSRSLFRDPTEALVGFSPAPTTSVRWSLGFEPVVFWLNASNLPIPEAISK